MQLRLLPSRVIRPRAVIFDLDGTLVDSVVDIAAACNAALVEAGLTGHSADRIRGYIGGGLARLAALAVSASTAGGGPLPATPALIARVHGRMERLYAANATERTRPLPGSMAALLRLQRYGVPLAVLSNKSHAATRHVVCSLFPAVRFAVVQGYPADGNAKPDPGQALAIARSLRLQPRAIALVGDGEHDLGCALRAGMLPLGATWGYRTPRQLLAAGAQRLLGHPFEVARLLVPS